MSLSWSALKDIGTILLEFVTRPRLEVVFDPSQTYHCVPDRALGGRPGMFVHVTVVNRGRRTARQCRGLLQEVLIENAPRVFEPAPEFRNPVELHWAHEPLDYFAKDIPGGERVRLDVCYAHQHLPLVHFFCEKRPRGIQTDFLAGRYKIKIRIRSQEGSKCEGKFLITWNGDFKKLHMEQLED